MPVLHIITPEYPPQPGGVSDYTCQLAGGLSAAGNDVHVWCPSVSSAESDNRGVTVHRKLGKFGIRDLRQLSRELNQFPGPRHVLVQWVPHGFGYRSMNIFFCHWLWRRATRSGDDVEIMVHEPFLAFGEGSWRQNFPALLHRLMTIILLRSAQRVSVAIPEWERRWRPYALGRHVPFRWLPVPSNVPVVHDWAGVEGIRRHYAPDGGVVIGHFGTYGTSITSLLEPVLVGCKKQLGLHTILLMGIGSDRFRDELLQREPELESTVHASGALSASDLSCHIAACDLLLQPYPDGVTTRRTSFMTGLSHGKALVTTLGTLSEPFWAETDAVRVAAASDSRGLLELVMELAADPGRRAALGRAAQTLYDERFDISHTVRAFLQTAPEKSECVV